MNPIQSVTSTAGPDALRALGAPEGDDPNFRSAYAPALVQSMKARQQEGVTLRALLGAGYTGTRNAASALNTFTAELAPAGIAVTDPDGIRVLCEEPLRLRTGLNLQFRQETQIVKAFAVKSNTRDALLAHDDWAVDMNAWQITGGLWTVASPSQTGVMFAVYGNNWSMRDMLVRDWIGGQAFLFGGNAVRMHNVDAQSETKDYGTGVFRCIGGRDVILTGLTGVGGDDCLQFVPITAPNNPRYDLSIEDAWYMNCAGRSNSSRALVAAIGGPQDKQIMTCKLRRIGFVDCVGWGGGTTLNIENTEGDPRISDQVTNIEVLNTVLHAGATDDKQAQAIDINGANGNIMSGVHLNNVTLVDNRRAIGMRVRGVRDLTLTNCRISGQRHALVVGNGKRDDAVGELLIRGGEYRRHIFDLRGKTDPGDVIRVGGGSIVGRLDIEGALIGGIGNGRKGIFAGKSLSSARLVGAKFDREPGARNTSGISAAPRVALELNALSGDVDKMNQGAR